MAYKACCTLFAFVKGLRPVVYHVYSRLLARIAILQSTNRIFRDIIPSFVSREHLAVFNILTPAASAN